MFGKDIVGTKSVDIFGVEEKAIHIEDAGAYGGKTIHLAVSLFCLSSYDHSSRDTAESRVQRIITDHLRHGKGFGLEGILLCFGRSHEA